MNISLLEFLYILTDALNTAFLALLDLPVLLYALFFLLSFAFCYYYNYRK